MARELFIYWHVDASQAAAALAATAAMQARLQASHSGLSARLYRRADLRGDKLTLMETYACGDADVGTELQSAIAAEAATALAPWCGGARHVEVFESAPA